MAGWTTGDNLTDKRMNRIWSGQRLAAPVYDVAEGGTVTADAKAVDGTYITTGEATHYTVSGSMTFSVVYSITITNTEGNTNQVSVHIVPNGGSRAVSNQIFAGTLQAGETIILGGPWIMATSDTIRSISSGATSGDVALRAEVMEHNLQPEGLTYKAGLIAALTTGFVTQYTCPSSLVRHANAPSITICNTDSTARTVEVAIIPSGQTQAARYNIFAGTVYPGETLTLGDAWQPFLLEPSDFIQAKASTGAVVSCRVSVIEYATT